MASLEHLRNTVRQSAEPDLGIELALWEMAGRPGEDPPAYTEDLDAAVSLVRKLLPGWWWSVGFCELTNDASVYMPGSKAYSFDAIAHASVGADFRSGAEAQRLLAASPVFDEGFHGDRVGGNVSLALIDAMLQGLIAVASLSSETQGGE